MANRLLAHLQALFKWALDRERVTASPIIGIRKPGDELSRDRYLSDDELPDVLRAIERESYPWSPIFRLLLSTGQRKNDVAAAKRSDCNLPRRELTIPRQRAKNKTSHVVPLTDEAVAIIEALPVINGSDYLFPAMRGGKKTVSGFGRAKARLDKIITAIRAERGEDPLPEWTVHDLRRTVATGLERLGVPLPVTEAVLGHTSGSKKGVVAVYQRHEYREEKRRALEAWARHLDGLRHPASAAKVVALRSGAV